MKKWWAEHFRISIISLFIVCYVLAFVWVAFVWAINPAIQRQRAEDQWLQHIAAQTLVLSKYTCNTGVRVSSPTPVFRKSCVVTLGLQVKSDQAVHWAATTYVFLDGLDESDSELALKTLVPNNSILLALQPYKGWVSSHSIATVRITYTWPQVRWSPHAPMHLTDVVKFSGPENGISVTASYDLDF